MLSVCEIRRKLGKWEGDDSIVEYMLNTFNPKISEKQNFVNVLKPIWRKFVGE